MANIQRNGMYQVLSSLRDKRDMVSSIKNEILIKTRDQNYESSLREFQNSSNKLELVTQKNGIDFINDSSSTTANGVWYALSMMTKPVTWIMSMDNLEIILKSIDNEIKSSVKRVVLLGVYNSTIPEYFKNLNIEILYAMNLEEAVNDAFYNSKSGDVILFSPGVVCDERVYSNVRERGNKFKEAIAQL